MPSPATKPLEIEWPRSIPRTCTQGMLVAAVRLWAKFATDLQIAQYLNIPPHAVKEYTSSLWWAEIVKQLRPQLDFDIENSFGRIGFKALEEIEDRLRYGDFYVNRYGERARRPLTAKDLAAIAALAIEKRTAARHLVDGTVDAAESGRSDLAVIADLLRQAAQRQQASFQTAKGDGVIDVTPQTGPETQGNPLNQPQNALQAPIDPDNVPTYQPTPETRPQIDPAPVPGPFDPAFPAYNPTGRAPRPHRYPGAPGTQVKPLRIAVSADDFGE
jgi:hypothetical protein